MRDEWINLGPLAECPLDDFHELAFVDTVGNPLLKDLRTSNNFFYISHASFWSNWRHTGVKMLPLFNFYLFHDLLEVSLYKAANPAPLFGIIFVFAISQQHSVL